MKTTDFAAVFSALANEHRLAAFRLLMPHGPSGLPAGDISSALGIPPSTLSTHLARLCAAGLLRATRRHRRILYAVDVEGTHQLIAYLTEDCCQGRPELCGYGSAFECTPIATRNQEQETTDD